MTEDGSYQMENIEKNMKKQNAIQPTYKEEVQEVHMLLHNYQKCENLDGSTLLASKILQ